MTSIILSPIGTIHSPFDELPGMPIQPGDAPEIKGTIQLLPEYVPGLQDVQGFSHLILIYFFHRVGGHRLRVKPFLDVHTRGVFSTRAPRRPNPIGISTVRLERIEGAILHISDIDIVDGTPLLDLKPYIPAFDDRPGAKTGWLEGKTINLRQQLSDDRFDQDEIA